MAEMFVGRTSLRERRISPLSHHPGVCFRGTGGGDARRIRVTANTGTAVTLEWDKVVSGVGPYDVTITDRYSYLSKTERAYGQKVSFSGLQPRHPYDVRIIPFDSRGWRHDLAIEYSFSTEGIFVPPLENVRAENVGATTATLRFTAPREATSIRYVVDERRNDLELARPTDGKQADADVPLVLSSLVPSKPYFVRIWPMHASGEAGEASDLSFATTRLLLPAPVNIRLTETGFVGTKLTWDSVPDANEYHVVVQTGDAHLRRVVRELSVRTLACDLSGLTPDTRYLVSVQPINVKHKVSGETSAAFPFATPPLTPPIGLRAEKIEAARGGVTADLIWGSMPGATYEFRIARNEQGTLARATVQAIKEPCYIASKLEGGVTYYWQVRAVAGDHHSNWSGPVSIATQKTEAQLRQEQKGEQKRAKAAQEERERAAREAARQKEKTALLAEEQKRAAEKTRKRRDARFALALSYADQYRSGWTDYRKALNASRAALGYLIRETEDAAKAQAEIGFVVVHYANEFGLTEKDRNAILKELGATPS